MSLIDELLAHNAAYAERLDTAGLPLQPARRLAIVACMDARLDPYAALGLSEGDAHVIRNAGGIVTEDVIRSLAISQRLAGTEEIVVIHHTDCGMLTYDDHAFKSEIRDETGVTPEWPGDTFTDLEHDVRASVSRIRDNPVLRATDAVRGFVYEVETGRLREVT